MNIFVAGVSYGTRLCGASNARAKETLGFRPRRLEWLTERGCSVVTEVE